MKPKKQGPLFVASTLLYGGGTLHPKGVIELPVYREGEYLICEWPDLGIRAYGQNRAALRRDLESNLGFVWSIFAKADWAELSPGAYPVKKAALDLFWEDPGPVRVSWEYTPRPAPRPSGRRAFYHLRYGAIRGRTSAQRRANQRARMQAARKQRREEERGIARGDWSMASACAARLAPRMAGLISGMIP